MEIDTIYIGRHTTLICFTILQSCYHFYHLLNEASVDRIPDPNVKSLHINKLFHADNDSCIMCFVRMILFNNEQRAKNINNNIKSVNISCFI